jgi:hypothetical protein
LKLGEKTKGFARAGDGVIKPSRITVLNGFLFAVAFIWTLPWPVGYPSAGLDPSWVLGIYWAFARHLQFGRDIVFTYGPLGFLDVPMLIYFGLWSLSFLFRLLSHAIFFAASFIFVVEIVRSKSSWTSLVYSLPVLLVLGLGAGQPPGEEVVLSTAVLFFVSGRQMSRGNVFAMSVSVLSCFLLALVSLVKYNYFFGAVLLLISILVLGFAFKNQIGVWLVSPCFYALFLLLLWAAAGQSFSDFIRFVQYGLEISVGYISAMAAWPSYMPRWEAVGLLAVAVALLLLFPVSLAYSLVRRKRAIASFVILVGGLLFESFRYGFVRYDFGHVLSFYAVLAPLLAFLATLTMADISLDRSSMKQVVPLLAPIGLIGLAASALVVFPTSAVAFIGENNVLARLGSYDMAIGFLNNPQTTNSAIGYVKSALTAQYGLDPRLAQTIGNSTVDIFPWDVALLWGYGLNWSPRPVFQSYSAYTAKLDQLNSIHFSGGSPPEYVLFSYNSIDGRYPIFDEPDTFRALLCRYEYLDADAHFALLRYTESDNCGAPREIARITARIGEFIPVPSFHNEYVFARVLIKYSLLGSLADLLYKPSAVYLHFRFTDGTQSQAFRFITSPAENGIFLSGYIGSLSDLLQLFQGHMARNIQSMAIVPDSQTDYASEVSIEYFGVSRRAFSITSLEQCGIASVPSAQVWVEGSNLALRMGYVFQLQPRKNPL